MYIHTHMHAYIETHEHKMLAHYVNETESALFIKSFTSGQSLSFLLAGGDGNSLERIYEELCMSVFICIGPSCLIMFMWIFLMNRMVWYVNEYKFFFTLSLSFSLNFVAITEKMCSNAIEKYVCKDVWLRCDEWNGTQNNGFLWQMEFYKKFKRKKSTHTYIHSFFHISTIDMLFDFIQVSSLLLTDICKAWAFWHYQKIRCSVNKSKSVYCITSMHTQTYI